MGPRDYDLESIPQPRFGLPAFSSVTKLLVGINVVVWLACYLIHPVEGPSRAVFESLTLSPELWRAWFPWPPVWQLITYGFLHSPDEPLHVLFNMLGLYFFGGMLEGVIGSRRFLWLYLTSIAVGGFVQLVVSFATQSSAVILGASGAVMFVIVAMAVLRPHLPVIFVIFPLKLRTLALIFVGLDVFRLVSALRGFGSDIAFAVHLSGAAFGFAAAKLGWVWLDPMAAWEARRARREVADLRSDEERLDALLQQIHDRGIGTLSRSEREFLKRMSSRKSG